jgi:hypothetical protein
MVDAPKSSPGTDAAMGTEEESPFRYYVPGERPRADAAFFELLLFRVVSQSGPLPNFDEVWPRGVQALAGLNALRLANLSGREIAAAVTLVGGEFGTRLADKTDSLVAWAESFWRIRQIYGSFRQYIRSFDNDGFEVLLADLKHRLPGLSPEFLTAFLREAGEKAPVAPGERSPQAPPRKPQTPTAAPTRPVAERPATGAADKGRRHRGRGSAPRPQATPAAAPATSTPGPKPAAPPQEKGTGQSRRNRRRFFHRKRSGGKNGTTQSQAKSPSPPAG